MNEAPEATGINSFTVLSGGTVDGFGLYISYETLPEVEGGSRYPAIYELELIATSENAAEETQPSAPFTVNLELTSPYDILDAREVLAENPADWVGEGVHALNISAEYDDNGTSTPFVDPANYAVVIDHNGGTLVDADNNPILDGDGNQIELTQNSDISIRFGEYGESGSLILAKGGADNIYLHNSAVGTDTVIYQVNTDGGVAGLDGTDQIYSFQLGVDRVFFLDTNEGNTDPTLEKLIDPGVGVTGMSMNFILQTSDNPGDDTPVSSIWINFGSGADLATVEFWPTNAMTVADIEAIFSDLNLVLEDDDTIPVNTVLNKDDDSFTAKNLEALFGAGNIEVISMDQLHEGDDDLQLYAVPADVL